MIVMDEYSQGSVMICVSGTAVLEAVFDIAPLCCSFSCFHSYGIHNELLYLRLHIYYRISS